MGPGVAEASASASWLAGAVGLSVGTGVGESTTAVGCRLASAEDLGTASTWDGALDAPPPEAEQAPSASANMTTRNRKGACREVIGLPPSSGRVRRATAAAIRSIGISARSLTARTAASSAASNEREHDLVAGHEDRNDVLDPGALGGQRARGAFQAPRGWSAPWARRCPGQYRSTRNVCIGGWRRHGGPSRWTVGSRRARRKG